MFANLISLLLFTSVLGVHKFYTHTDTNSFGDFSLGAGFDINRFEPKSSHVFRESKDDLFYDIMPITSTKSRCSLIARQKDISDKLKVFGSVSVSYKMISGSGEITFDQKKETMNRVAYYSCTIDRTLFTISVNAPEITSDWANIQGEYIPDNLFQLNAEELQTEVGDYHVRSITYGRRYNTEIRMEYSSEDAFELISGKLKADIGIGALKVAAEVEVDKETDTFEEDLTLTISSEALGFIEPESVFMPANSLKVKNDDGTWSGAELSVTDQVEQMIKKNLEEFNKIDAATIQPQTGLSKKELFEQIGSAYPLWYTVERNFPYFKDQLTKLSAFEEERMLKNLNQAYDILRELEDMTQDVESRAELLFENYHLLSGATDLSKEFLKYRQDLLDEILLLQNEVLEYLEQTPIQLAKQNIYMWASNANRELHYISIDVLHTKVWDLLGMQDVPMEDENEIGSTCLFNGVQATLEGGNRRKFAGRVVFGDVTVRHVIFDINGAVVSLGFIDHEYDNRKDPTWKGAPHELVFVREDCTLLKAGDDVWYQNARYTIDSIGSEEYMTPRGYVNKEKLTNIRLHLTPQDTTRKIAVVLTDKEVADVKSRGFENSFGLTLDDEHRLMYQNGYVCDKGFTKIEAKMICTHLGYSSMQHMDTGFQIPPSNAWGRPRITMVSLDCPQYAFRLDECTYKTIEESNWDLCGTDNGVQLICSNEIAEAEETAKMDVTSDTGKGCVMDISALNQKIDTAESCSGGTGDDASNFGIVETVVARGDICVKLYRDSKLQCAVYARDAAWDFTNNQVLARFCYGDAFNSPTQSGLVFPDEIEMMSAKREEDCLDQDDLVKDMQYQYDGNTLAVVDCETGKSQGLCEDSSKLEEKDQIIFQKACKRSCGTCQPNLRNHYQVKVVATENSFAFNGADKIPVIVSLKSGSEKEDEEFIFADNGEHVFDDDISCGTQRQISIKPEQVYNHGSVVCSLKQTSDEREGRIDSDGKVIMAGDLTVTFECFNPPSFAPTFTPTNSPITETHSPTFSPTIEPTFSPTVEPTHLVDNSCGVNGNSWGTAYTKIAVGSSCNCAAACDDDANCVGWTYVPDSLFTMGTNDCMLLSTTGDLIDNCGGKCRTGVKTKKGNSDVLKQCEDWGTLSKHHNGCRAYHRGWDKGDYDCAHCGETSRDYAACDFEECKRLCVDLYSENLNEFPHCTAGCEKYHELGGCSSYILSVTRPNDWTSRVDLRNSIIAKTTTGMSDAEIGVWLGKQATGEIYAYIAKANGNIEQWERIANSAAFAKSKWVYGVGGEVTHNWGFWDRNSGLQGRDLYVTEYGL